MQIQDSKVKMFLVRSLGVASLLMVALMACTSQSPSATPISNMPSSDFTLPSVAHSSITLSSYQGQQPVVLVFYRAYWCSACRRQLDELNSNYDKIAQTGAEVIALSTDNLDNTRNLVASRGYKYPIVYTSGDSSIPQNYDRFNKFGDGLASAAIFIIDVDGNIVWQELGRNPYHFVRSKEIIAQLEAT